MPQNEASVWIVRLELQRIQTFLFAVPRLRAMLGANALLGQAIRCELPGLARPPKCPPWQLEWPGDPPVRDGKDTLGGASGGWPAGDDPVESLTHGVLSRDGGHLRIAFKEPGQADAFIARARGYLDRTLPGLMYSLDRVQADSEVDAARCAVEDELADPFELPQLQVCTRSGTDVASEPAMTPEGEAIYISSATKAKEDAGEEFQKTRDTASRCDYISLLRAHMPRSEDQALPRDLDELSDSGGYLAVVHADGNRIGQRIKAHLSSLGELDWLAEECAVEHFFHGMRSAVRGALMEALRDVFTTDELDRHASLPYQLLMLGGDDLLLACHPRYALPFVERFAYRLKDRKLADGKPLSIGAGVIIAKHNLPFHRLHQLAESLGRSAKRAYLQYKPGAEKDALEERSVVDWSVLTASWGEDPLEMRCAHDHLVYGEGNDKVILGLTTKPYFVLEEHAADGDIQLPSLQALLATVKDLEEVAELPRSQLKDMLRRLGTGYLGAELAYQVLWQRMPESARDALRSLIDVDSLWIRVSGDKQPIRAITQLKDLVECLELRYLGRRKQEKRHD